MKVTAQEEYGLRCMMQAAASGSDRPVSVAVIASSEGISTAYAAKILNLLRDAGLVESMRGRCGGYYITHPPDRISVSEILAALGGRLFEAEYCERFPGDEDECVHLGECSLRSLWGTLEGLLDRVLRRTSLADLMDSEKRVTASLLDQERRMLPMVPEPMGCSPSEIPGDADEGK